MYGCGLAWELARRAASVTVLEAEAVAAGASGGPGRRGVRANSRDERELPLSRLANEIWPALGEELGADIGYQSIGGLELFESETSRGRAIAQVARQARHGIESRLVERRDLLHLEPGLSAGVLGAVYCPRDGVVDHTATTLAYAAAAERHGAQIIERTRALSVEQSAVVTADGRFEAGRAVVVLANAGARALLEPLGIALPGGRVFPQIVFTDPTAPSSVRHLIGHFERQLAVKQEPDGSLMISGGWLGRWNAAARRGEVVADRVEGNVADARAVFPAMDGASITGAFADRAESVGPELVPVVDFVPGVDRLVVGAGWSGHGFAIAPAVVRLLAQWLLEDTRPAELAPFGWRS